MPTPVHLTLSCGTYDINQGLITGDVVPQGIELTVLTAASPERHWRMVRDAEFDVCEFSIGTYLMIHERDDPEVIAIPAFPHRRFRHGYIFINTASGIRAPKDLDGRRVGIRTWQTSAGVWARGILQDDHGVDLRSITWVAQDEEDIPLPEGHAYRIERVPDGRSVTDMLVEGELDALIYPDLPDAVRRGDPRVARLFPDPRAAEIEWYGRTGFFPIMHTVLLRRSIAEAHPWIPRELLTAFEASKRRAFAAMADPRRVSLAWFSEAMEEQTRVLGPDPWSYGFEANRATLETVIRWSHEQGMIGRRFPPEELFAASTLVDLPRYV
jgi:4,5-dihydroxyphthalate decarboxylase